jgi:hypothetical protein
VTIFFRKDEAVLCNFSNIYHHILLFLHKPRKVFDGELCRHMCLPWV